MTMIGADVEALRVLATDFASGAAELQQLSAELARAIDDADDWQGPDAVRCKDQFGELARTRMTSVADALETAGKLLEGQATEQEIGSSVQSLTAAPSFLDRLQELWAWTTKGWGLGTKLAGLGKFLLALTKPLALRSAALLAVAKSLVGLGWADGGMLTKDWVRKLLPAAWLEKIIPWAAKVGPWLPVASMVFSAVDVYRGGGLAGWRGNVTRVLAGANVVAIGTGLLMGATALAAAPVTAAAIVGTGVAYAAWSLGNVAYDHSPWFKGVVDNSVTSVRDTWHSAWQGVRSNLDISRTFARGLLGPAPTPIGASR